VAAFAASAEATACCARAASGHAAAPPMNAMNARRFIRSPNGFPSYGVAALLTLRSLRRPATRARRLPRLRAVMLCFDRLPRAVCSGEGAGSIGRAADAVSYKDLRVLSVWGADKHHAEVDQWNDQSGREAHDFMSQFLSKILACKLVRTESLAAPSPRSGKLFELVEDYRSRA
jgi:ribosome modulation factor